MNRPPESADRMAVPDLVRIAVACVCVFFFWVAPSYVCAQHSAQSSNDPASELSSHEEATTFKVNVKLVLLRVVVRDVEGRAVGNLRKEDFELFDKGKPQVITQFEAEHEGGTLVATKDAQGALTDLTRLTQTPGSVPERYIAYLFDDLHLDLANLATLREAALRHLETLQATDRAAVFTTSGKTMLDFTDDRAKLNDALLRIAPPPKDPSEIDACPNISYYVADLIINKQDPAALSAEVQDFIGCTQLQTRLSRGQAGAPVAKTVAVPRVLAQAQTVLSKGNAQTQLSLGVLKDVVRRISALPGQRTVIVVSPGFLFPQMRDQYEDIVDKAVHGQVVVGTIDARGLYAPMPSGGASRRGTPNFEASVVKSPYDADAIFVQADLLAGLAEDTGGIFFHNNNDFDKGFDLVAGPPEYSYILGFSPQDLKPDGSYHPLKVTLKNQQKLTVLTRRGYFAPTQLANPEEQAKREMEDELFSQEELHDLPVELHTQFYKAADDQAKVTVLAHVDVRRLRFRKADGRNDNVLTFDTALFNHNGSFLKGVQKVLTMRLKDETLENKFSSGITLKTSFDVPPGSYLVRLVVRDTEAQVMSAETGTVEIP